MTENKTAMVVSAHSADFVWRAGGAIALYAGRGWEITVVCLSYGERGESAKLWREPGMTMDEVKANRKEEATRAAEILGAKTVFFDVGDYPMRVSDAVLTIRSFPELHRKHESLRKRTVTTLKLP